MMRQVLRRTLALPQPSIRQVSVRRKPQFKPASVAIFKRLYRTFSYGSVKILTESESYRHPPPAGTRMSQGQLGKVFKPTGPKDVVWIRSTRTHTGTEEGGKFFGAHAARDSEYGFVLRVDVKNWMVRPDGGGGQLYVLKELETVRGKMLVREDDVSDPRLRSYQERWGGITIEHGKLSPQGVIDREKFADAWLIEHPYFDPRVGDPPVTCRTYGSQELRYLVELGHLKPEDVEAYAAYCESADEGVPNLKLLEKARVQSTYKTDM